MGATSESAAVPPAVGIAAAAGGEQSRTRMSATDRRAQLTEIGLELLADRPIHELALDEVAERAGISRTLLFHYFPSKSDYYAAVVERAGQRLLATRREGIEPVAGQNPEQRVRRLVDGYLRLVEGSRDLYVRLVRGAAGGDPAVMATIDDLRTALIPVWIDAAGWPPATAEDPLVALMVRGWLVGLEEVALAWHPDQVPLTALTDALVDSFLAITAHS